MTPFKNFSQPSADASWKRRLRRGGIYVAVAALLAGATACNNDNGSDWEEVQVEAPTKGVVTTLEEVSGGEYSIVDEQVVERPEDSRVVIKRLNGTVDTLNLDQARAFVNPSDTTSNHQSYTHVHHHGLGRTLWWGAMGYMMGRSFSSPVQPYVYRDDRNSGFRSGGGYYGGGYRSGSSVTEDLRRTSTTKTVLRPAKARSGFFGRSSRGRSWGG